MRLGPTELLGGKEVRAANKDIESESSSFVLFCEKLGDKGWLALVNSKLQLHLCRAYETFAVILSIHEAKWFCEASRDRKSKPDDKRPNHARDIA